MMRMIDSPTVCRRVAARGGVAAMYIRRCLWRATALSFVLLLVLVETTFADGDGGSVLGVDLSRLDANGLLGPPDGKRALSYEFCIPDENAPASEVQRIDPSARLFRASPGRIGCGTDQVLVIGHTHQPYFATILHRLAGLPYVERIERSDFE